jgi:uncharacterized protein (UPF0254 family)
MKKYLTIIFLLKPIKYFFTVLSKNKRYMTNKKKLVIFILSGMVATVSAQTIPSAEQVRQDRSRGIVLPESDGHYKAIKNYVEEIPDADYVHASEAAHEAFRDI